MISVSNKTVLRWLREESIPRRDTRNAKLAEMSHWTDKEWATFHDAGRKAGSVTRGRAVPHDVVCARAKGKQRSAKLSEDERIVLDALHAAGLHPIPLFAIDRHNIDFAFPDISLAVEYNGGNWHNLPQVKANDDRKDALLRSLGWHVLWFPRIVKDDRASRGPSIALEELVAQVVDAVHRFSTNPQEQG